MRQMQRLMSATARLRQKGSALLVALMTLVGLSLLGLAFVAMSETESAISVNQRNHAQVVATSETGAREVVQWFQNPDQALSTATGVTRMMPDQSTAVATWAKTNRVVQAYHGYYKDSTTKKLCDLPYGPDDDDVLFGNEASADIIIDRSTSNGRDFLDTNFNPGLLGTGNDPRDTGEVTSIRIFAPPILGGALITDTGGSGHSFWVNGTRLGVATIAVKVDKYDKPRTDSTRRSIATATCRIVVGQFPLPTPAGPLQSQTALQTQGNFNVNWGIVASGATLQLAKDYQTLPWVNAYELVHFERGYDSSVEFQTNHQYFLHDIVRPTVAELNSNPVLKAHEYEVTTAGTTTTEPPATGAGAWPTASANTVTSGSVTFTERFPTAYPINTSLPQPEDSNHPWLFYVGSGTFNVQDPWFQARAVGAINGDPAGAHPYPFPYLGSGTPISYGATHHFQNQSFNSFPDYRQVIFPTMDYNFWKATALAANGIGGVHYVWPQGNVATDIYTDGVNSGDLTYWASNNNGFTFFDTVNQQNPQNGGSGILNQSQGAGTASWLQGFVYINAPWHTTGQGHGNDGWFNQPGEPYEDIGFREVAESTNGTQVGGNFVTDASGQPIIIDAYNNQWDYQDLAWSNTGNGCCSGTKNKIFDVYVRQRHVYNPGTNSWYDGYFVVPYVPGCHPGDNSCGGCNCSEPHEPYLNVIYVGGTEPNQDNANVLFLNMGWQDPNNVTRVAKRTDDGTGAGTPVPCTSTSSTADCTSNAYDKRGGLVQLHPGPLTTGVLYCEGQFGTSGNGIYYGAVLAGSGGVDPTGTPHVWYDSSLQDGSWLPPGLPRVLITSLQMDQN